jgi:hypothetical protein
LKKVAIQGIKHFSPKAIGISGFRQGNLNTKIQLILLARSTCAA